ncbi:MAG TPA: TldD/PmbA family protein, partial [Nitrospirota bacterium]
MFDDYSKILIAALAKGGDYADLFIEETRPVAISLEDGKVEKVISGREIGAGIRVIIGFRSVYAYTNDISERALLDLAASVARAVNGDGRDLIIDLRQKKPVFDFSVAEPPEGVDIARKLALVRSMDGAARAADTRVSQVMVMYRDTVQDITVASSDGFLTKDQRHYTVAAANVIAKDENSVQTGYESAGGNAGLEIFRTTPPELIGEKAAKRATQALTARKAPGGSMPVVLSSEAGGTMVHEAVGHGLEADLAQNGLSVY